MYTRPDECEQEEDDNLYSSLDPNGGVYTLPGLSVIASFSNDPFYSFLIVGGLFHILQQKTSIRLFIKFYF